jgi:hypothetical protein
VVEYEANRTNQVRKQKLAMDSPHPLPLFCVRVIRHDSLGRKILAQPRARASLTVPSCPENEKKQSSQRQATEYGDNACDNGMPLDAAEREIDHGAD